MTRMGADEEGKTLHVLTIESRTSSGTESKRGVSSPIRGGAQMGENRRSGLNLRGECLIAFDRAFFESLLTSTAYGWVWGPVSPAQGRRIPAGVLMR